MEFIIHKNNNNMIAEIAGDEIIINNLQDALDMIANISYNEINRIIIKEKNIVPDFFKLSTGLAGDVLQKCVNYNIKMAIVGSFENHKSKSLNAFIIECNRGKQFFFVNNTEKAKEMLEK